MKKLLYISIFIFAVILVNAEEKFPPDGSNIAAMAELENAIIRQIKLLDSDKWERRKKARKELLALIEKNEYTFKHFIKTTSGHQSPEVKLTSKEILEDYFKKHVHDPDRKKGFIGISMKQGLEILIDKKRYLPIYVGIPITGYPGIKAGIKENDMIIEVDNFICSKKFDMNSFITYVAAKKPGEIVTLKLISDGKTVTKKITLAARPKSDESSLPAKSVKELFEEWYSLQLHDLSK